MGTADPFMRYEFLSALENSGSVTARAGWQPYHAALHDSGGEIIACMPLYLKSHSYGEFVFDHEWAFAWQQLGKAYYPKLVGAVPFTPVPGSRLGVAPGFDGAALRARLVEAVEAEARALGVSSVHILFASARADQHALQAWLPRRGVQYHWHNHGYQSWEDFLQHLSSRKRKTIRKERQALEEEGVRFTWRRGHELDEALQQLFYTLYASTYDQKWGSPYLTRDFFTEIFARLGNETLCMWGEHQGSPIAVALNLEGADALYGRHWGASVALPFLHFECCYYQAVDYAIAHGLSRVEAGAQGAHKYNVAMLRPRPGLITGLPSPSSHTLSDNFLPPSAPR